MSGEYKGKVIKVYKQEPVKEYFKQQFAVESEGKYPKKACFVLWGDACDFVPSVGDDVTVSYNPESREYMEKWYTDLKAFKVENHTKEPLRKKGLGIDEDPVVTDDDENLPF